MISYPKRPFLRCPYSRGHDNEDMIIFYNCFQVYSCFCLVLIFVLETILAFVIAVSN